MSERQNREGDNQRLLSENFSDLMEDLNPSMQQAQYIPVKNKKQHFTQTV